MKGVSLTVEQGQLVALIGANGAGKSTTCCVRCRGCFRRSTAASSSRATDIAHCSPRADSARAASRIVRRGATYSPNMTVEENLEMGAYLRADATEIAADRDRIFDQFPRLAERRKQIAGTLSGGEQQMLAIGRALMSRPKLMMFDEPSLGLAPNIVEQVFEIIAGIRASGTTVLMVEQNAYAALEMCDFAYLLESGVIATSGKGADLIDNPHVQAAYLGG